MPAIRVTDHPVVGKVRWQAISPVRKGGPIRLLDGWREKHIVTVHVPQLEGVPTYGGKTFSGRVPFFKGAAGQLQAAWAEVEERGLLDRVLFWGGSLVVRFIRGSVRTPSNHAFGTAFDINVPWNGLGNPPPPAGMKGSVRELVPTFEKHGFGWGGNYRHRPDGMHFEVKRLGKPQAGTAPRAVEVFIDEQQEVIPALFIAGKTWIGVRAFTRRVGGKILKAGGDPFTVEVQVGDQRRELPGRNIGGTGYVAFGELIPLYKFPYHFNNAQKRLDVTTKT